MERIHDYVVDTLRANGYTSWRAVSDATGVPLSTVCKVAYRHTKNPRIGTLEKLAAHLRQAGASQ